MIVHSWVNPKAKKAASGIDGIGLFADYNIHANEVVGVKAGHIIDKKTLNEKADIIKNSELQISDDLFIAPLEDKEFEASMIYFNHSCEPNSGMAGNIFVVAMRDIKAGEELTLDYAMFATSIAHEFDCKCTAASCRKKIKNTDWQIPELQAKYKDYYSWYLKQKISGLK